MKGLDVLKTLLKVSSLFLFLCVSAALADDDLIDPLKKERIELEKQKALEDTSKLKKDWLNRINASYSKSNNYNYDETQEYTQYSVSLSQPLFKSGGIYFGIMYAVKAEESLLYSIDTSKEELINSIYSLAIDLRILDLQIERQTYLIKNLAIDLLKKEEAYNSGLSDSSELDRALLDKNSAETALYDLKIKKSTLVESYKNIANIAYDTLVLPELDLVDTDEFLSKNRLLKQNRIDTEKLRYKKNGTISTYLPEVSVQASYNKEKIEGGLVASRKDWDEYGTFGFTVSVPLLDMKMYNTIESSRIEYLKSRLETSIAKSEQENFFEQKKSEYEIKKEKEKLIERDIKLYDSLLNLTTESRQAGEKTDYDVETMQNSLAIKKLDMEIIRLEQKSTLLDIYKKIDG